MSNSGRSRVGLPIHALPVIVSRVIERASGSAPPKLAMTSLRVKPGRGLVAVYRLVSSRNGEPQHPPLVCLTIDETGVERFRRLSDRLLQSGEVEGSWPGIVSIPGAGLNLQSFPTDLRLPALATACDLAPGSPTFAALAAAASELYGDLRVRLRSATVEPLRYKPGDRCVVRYSLRLQADSRPVETTLVGKVYRDADVARRVHDLLVRMHAEQLHQTGEVVAGVPFIAPLAPRPVGTVSDLGLTLSEDVGRPGAGVMTGVDALGRGGGGTEIPARRLVVTAVALARLHHGTVQPDSGSVRTARSEATRAIDRAERLAEFAPELGDRARTIARRLGRLLLATAEAAGQPAHGSFKSAQLLFRRPDEVLVTDFDQFCQADPALDVGYFLAYLRPPSLWYRHASARDWFSGSAQAFVAAYAEAAVELGGGRPAVTDALERAPLYEAALLFKIANRRPNRLNSLRPLELEAILGEADACLAGARR